jgi:hypothetical protein
MLMTRFMRSRAWLTALVAAALALLAPVAHADTITMHGGTIYYGEILEETPKTVTIRTKVANIVTTLTLKRSDISLIERTGNAVRPGYFEEKDKPKQADDAAGNDDDSATLYVLIPIHGEIGKESMADGVENALDGARRAKIRHVVFDIDTPGGSVAHADRMAKAIAEHREKTKAWKEPVRIHAYVHRAISAGIWVMFSCDSIFWADGATAGGAVVFRQDQSTGAAEVDAKMNSIIAAELAATAQQLGHRQEIVRAMMLPPSSLYTWVDSTGARRISDSRPPRGEAADAHELDGPEGILTLTTTDALELGLGTLAPDGPESLGSLIGTDGWKAAGKGGAAAMKQAARTAQAKQDKAERDAARAAELKEKALSLLTTLDPAIARAQAADPYQGSYQTINGVFTGDSQAEWTRRTASALKLWDKVFDIIKDLDKMDREHIKLTSHSIFDRENGRMVASQVEEIMSRLRTEAGKNKP